MPLSAKQVQILIGLGVTDVVANYSALPAANTVPDHLYWTETSQGTSWLPGNIGGTFYPLGLYYSNGTTWEFMPSAYQATQGTVNTGTNNDQFVTPLTFTNAGKWTTKENTITVGTTAQYWRGDKTFQTLDKASVGLGNVDNTSDANKPLSTATTTALAAKTNRVTSTVDNQIVRFDSTTGDQQGSLVTIDDNGGIIVTGVAGSTFTARKIEYDTTINQWIAYDNDSAVAMNLGYELWYLCKNNTGSTIANGKAVYIITTDSGIPTIALAQANAAATTVAIGITTESIATGNVGKVTLAGLVNGVDTSALVGGPVYLSATVAGGLTNTPPVSPNYVIRVGFIGAINATTGSVLVTPSTARLGNGTSGQVLGINGSGNQAFLDNTGYALTVNATTVTATPADATTYYMGINAINTLRTAAGTVRVYVPKAGTIKAAYIMFSQSAGATNETSTIAIRLNNTTDTTISSSVMNNAGVTFVGNTSLSIAVVAGDYFEIKWTTPTWVTNPVSFSGSGVIYIE